MFSKRKRVYTYLVFTQWKVSTCPQSNPRESLPVNITGNKMGVHLKNQVYKLCFPLENSPDSIFCTCDKPCHPPPEPSSGWAAIEKPRWLCLGAQISLCDTSCTDNSGVFPERYGGWILKKLYYMSIICSIVIYLILKIQFLK